MKGKEHLPLLGVGPIIVAGQIIITVIDIIVSYYGNLEFYRRQEFDYWYRKSAVL